MGTPHVIVNKPVATTEQLKEQYPSWAEQINQHENTSVATDFTETARCLSSALIEIAKMTLPPIQQRDGDGGLVTTLTPRVIVLKQYEATLKQQLENLRNLKLQKPSGLGCFGNSQKNINTNRKKVEAVLGGYQALQPKDLAFYLGSNFRDSTLKNQAARDLINIMVYSLKHGDNDSYKLDENWGKMARAMLNDDATQTVITDKPQPPDVLTQNIISAMTQLLALHLIAPSVSQNKATYTQQTSTIFSDLFNQVQNGDSFEHFDWKTTHDTLQNLKNQATQAAQAAPTAL